MKSLPILTITSAHQRPFPHFRNVLANVNSHITASVRRHKRQRHRREKFPVRTPSPSRSHDTTEIITFDMTRMKQRATEAVNKAENSVLKLKNSVLGFSKDLRRSVVVTDQGFVIIVRYSTLQFFAGALLCSVFIALVYKLIRGRMWEWRGGENWVWRRDRSLGGKEVLVSKRGSSTSYAKGFSPLATADWESRSESELLRNKVKRGSARKETSVSRLPSWWPPPDVRPLKSPQDSAFGQLRANALLKAIEDSRISGRDLSEKDILQLRHICKTSGVTVSFETDYERDSLYRVAINFVLASCSSSPHGSSSPRIGGEEATQFLSGLAENIGIKADRAVTMVNAAVASKTYSCFLQAWALVKQGNNFEAYEVFQKLSQIHLTFPPEENSPEIDMVAEGLRSHISLEDRKQLLKMLAEVCSSFNQRVAVEALGLLSIWEGTKNKFAR